jgi:DNA-directed RNA polymerase III subunit RPC4
MDMDHPSGTSPAPKKVKFAADAKPPGSESTSTPPPPHPAPDQAAPDVSDETQEIHGVIGQLEIYRSGTVKMRLENGILLDVNKSFPPCNPFELNSLILRSQLARSLPSYNMRFTLTCRINGSVFWVK